MAEQTGDKTEAPTPRRRSEAREKGQVARSSDLSSAVMILAAIILVGMTGQNIVAAMASMMEKGLGPDTLARPQVGMLVPLVVELFLTVARAALPLMLGMLVVAIAINLFQVGLNITPKKLAPSLNALNPLKGLSRIFGGGGRGWVQMIFNLLKLTLIGTVCYSAVHGKLASIVTISAIDHVTIFKLATGIIYDIALRVAIVLLILAIFDFAWQKWRHEQDLKMTKQEVKDEMKRMEGDPMIKQRRRQIAMQRAMQRVNTAVPGADVIVTNPTHFAVALKYDPDQMNAPKVVAKGADFLALRIRAIASENGIPIIERPPLARALYRNCEVGQEIPEQFYSTVAEILAYVWEITGRRSMARAS
jgi:flagellar biosynthesis protein FlhB